METTMQPQESQIKEGQSVMTQPEEVRADAPNPLVGSLEAAVKGTMDQIRHCDEQIVLWQKKKQQLQTTLSESLARQLSNGTAKSPAPAQKKPEAPRMRVNKNSSIPDLILTFLEKHGPARSKDIRKFLLAHGRTTNPGVSLGRMVKKGDIKNVERGLYQLS